MSTLKAIRSLMSSPNFRVLPDSGPMSASMINEELGRGATQTLSLDDPEVRDLAEVSSGELSYGDFHGKSSGPVYLMTVGYYDQSESINRVGFENDTFVFGDLTPRTLPEQPHVLPDNEVVLLTIMRIEYADEPFKNNFLIRFLNLFDTNERGGFLSISFDNIDYMKFDIIMEKFTGTTDQSYGSIFVDDEAYEYLISKIGTQVKIKIELQPLPLTKQYTLTVGEQGSPADTYGFFAGRYGALTPEEWLSGNEDVSFLICEIDPADRRSFSFSSANYMQWGNAEKLKITFMSADKMDSVAVYADWLGSLYKHADHPEVFNFLARHVGNDVTVTVAEITSNHQ